MPGRHSLAKRRVALLDAQCRIESELDAFTFEASNEASSEVSDTKCHERRLAPRWPKGMLRSVPRVMGAEGHEILGG